MATPDRSDSGVEHAATVDFAYDTERRARTVEASVAVEVGEIDDARSGADVTREGRVVRVDVVAADLVALRAGVNTWMRLVAVAEEVAGLRADSASALGIDPDAPGDSREIESPADEIRGDESPAATRRDDERPTDEQPAGEPPGTDGSGRDTPGSS